MAMQIYKPLRAALLIYESLRLAALAFIFISSPIFEGALDGRLFPYLVYLSPNALFPIIALFLLISFWDFKNYLPLYTAGKIIALINFYVWAIVSFRPVLSRQFLSDPAYTYNMIMGNLALGLGDLLSVLGACFLLNKIRAFRRQEISRALADNDGNKAVYANISTSVDSGGS